MYNRTKGRKFNSVTIVGKVLQNIKKVNNRRKNNIHIILKSIPENRRFAT